MEMSSGSGKYFVPGKSGNPKGRPKGSLNKATLLAQHLLAGEAEALTRKAIELAKEGNLVALRLCLERLLPPMRNRPLSGKLPEIATTSDVSAAYKTIFAELGKGNLTVEDALGISDLLRARLQAVDIERLTTGLTELEEGISK